MRWTTSLSGLWAEFPHGAIYVMTLERTNAGINNMEGCWSGVRTSQVHRSVAAGFANEADQLYRISWLYLPGDLVGLKFSNI